MQSGQLSRNDWTRSLSTQKMIIKKCPDISMFEEEDITNNQFNNYPVTVSPWLA
jgi:hypothetical protein